MIKQNKKEMKKLILISILIIAVGCKEDLPDYKTAKMPLRQLMSKEITSKYSSGGMFFFIASYSSGERTENKVNMFVCVDGNYRILSIPLEDIRVNINDSIDKPYLQIKSYTNYSDDESLCNNLVYTGDKSIVLYCPERFLPEKLLPITLN